MTYYYVTVSRDRRAVGVLVGPFSTRDVAAAWVEPIRHYVGERYPSHAFDVYGVGTSRKRMTGKLSRTLGFSHH